MKYRFLLITAYFAWGIPLIAGTICLAGYWVTRDLLFPSVGIVVLIAGFFLALAGVACAAGYILANRDLRGIDRKKGQRRAYLAAGLLIVNFPVALLYVLLGGYLGNRIHLEVTNTSSQPMDRIVVVSSSARLDIGSLDPGEEISFYFNPRTEGKVSIQVASGQTVKEAEITGYAAAFGIDDSRIVIDHDLDIHVQKMNP